MFEKLLIAIDLSLTSDCLLNGRASCKPPA